MDETEMCVECGHSHRGSRFRPSVAANNECGVLGCGCKLFVTSACSKCGQSMTGVPTVINGVRWHPNPCDFDVAQITKGAMTASYHPVGAASEGGT